MIPLAVCLLVPPLERAHSHNDYLQDRPLFAALDAGFISVEADVFLVNGKLLVAHERSDLSDGKTLDAMYLKPLAERARANGGRIYPTGRPFILMIDIKEEGEKVYTALKTELEPYKDLLTDYREPQGVKSRGITIILSGDRPITTVAKETERFVFLDGRLSDLAPNETSAELYPLISDDWDSISSWRGEGEFPMGASAKLKLAVDRAHSQKQIIRFWNITPAMWQTLWDAHVDLIGTDDIPGLAKWMEKR